MFRLRWLISFTNMSQIQAYARGALFIIALLAHVTEAGAAPITYTLTDLGSLSGAPMPSTAAEINDFGQVVGSVRTSSSASRAFLWTPATSNGTTGSMAAVDGLSLPGHEGTGSGINSRGQVVGYRYNGAITQAFVWSPIAPNSATGSAVSLGNVPGAEPGSTGSSINDRGQATGASISVTINDRAFLWSPSIPNGSAGSMTNLGTLPSDVQSIGECINSFGQVVGRGRTRALLWTPAVANGSTGSMVSLGTLGDDFTTSSAEAINDAGYIVGGSFGIAGLGMRAFLWTPSLPNASAGSMVQLSGLPTGSNRSSAFGINNVNQVVGYAGTDDEIFAMLWSAESGMSNLNALIDVTTAARWSLSVAFDINNVGQIVGVGAYDPDGAGGVEPFDRAFLLSPNVPEPACVAVVLLSVISNMRYVKQPNRALIASAPRA